MENLVGLAVMVFTPSLILAAVVMARRPGGSIPRIVAMGVILACVAWLVSAAISKLQLITGWRAYGIDLSSIALIVMVAGLFLFPLVLAMASLFGLKDHQGTIWPGMALGIVIAIVLHNNVLDLAPVNGNSMARLALDGLTPMVLWPPYRIGVRWLKNRLIALGQRPVAPHIGDKA